MHRRKNVCHSLVRDDDDAEILTTTRHSGNLSPQERAASAATHTVSPYHLRDEAAHWKTLHELQARACTARQLAALERPTTAVYVRPSTSARHRLESAWSFYDSMQHAQSEMATAAVTCPRVLLDELARFQKLADVFRHVAGHETRLMHRDELLLSAAKFNFRISESEATVLLAFLNSQRPADAMHAATEAHTTPQSPRRRLARAPMQP
ncbi:hypothetical protein SDRG_07974 [Saprolegnia diclina VS20]|uniref:Uncharacterized protein n=1 Tax=Saprolegnia diclina (strain VS20) TaxID=1156394 RepID=T0Q9S0_SAPDV|nr:hypothetical protein SDRG_07974 [Saprolegnia diclina VS20]EQC34654.1 hypothetical protein SDRG_07974 [Saprolegnia diclina VS20]|eukprot:XP_008612060.1 hypothetical protein SDRG_07974 [Saprolegnia diclina VS20]